MKELKIESIAKIHNDFTTKFGIPRQSGLCENVVSKIVFHKKYRNPDAFRGIEEYSHLWLLWYFSESDREGFTPTVRPPKLGGNTRMGVFATRSPFRPNPVGLSCVKLLKVEADERQGIVLYVSGADLMNGTEIFDIKPYLPYCDSKADAKNGFALATSEGRLVVKCEDSLLEKIPQEKRSGLFEVLSQDPRPAYQEDSERVYVMPFSDFEVAFKVSGDTLEIVELKTL
ncbi:MAG: tRNA (N6-threonylcarbamoyladenosine(37)-N6)-methyltransferase TrmO [Oscillospiraceae bacterium]|nr:tRNA (N6-threonylcarbamoyladenosine(37)-N6)-methyltransferase TrmO [Oscillospiraceae bacterium]